jgi:hypothetical protein
MQLEDYFNFLAADDIRLKGTRIGIETILFDYLFRNRTPEEIASIYSSLTVGENLEELLLIAEASFEDEYQDRIDFLPYLNVPLNHPFHAQPLQVCFASSLALVGVGGRDRDRLTAEYRDRLTG